MILVDSTDPISVGEGLFTQEFYKDCFRILTDEGILVNQHESPYYEKYAQEMKKAHDKIKSIFPISKVYQFTNQHMLLDIGFLDLLQKNIIQLKIVI